MTDSEENVFKVYQRWADYGIKYPQFYFTTQFQSLNIITSLEQ